MDTHEPTTRLRSAIMAMICVAMVTTQTYALGYGGFAAMPLSTNSGADCCCTVTCQADVSALPIDDDAGDCCSSNPEDEKPCDGQCLCKATSSLTWVMPALQAVDIQPTENNSIPPHEIRPESMVLGVLIQPPIA